MWRLLSYPIQNFFYFVFEYFRDLLQFCTKTLFLFILNNQINYNRVLAWGMIFCFKKYTRCDYWAMTALFTICDTRWLGQFIDWGVSGSWMVSMRVVVGQWEGCWWSAGWWLVSGADGVKVDGQRGREGGFGGQWVKSESWVAHWSYGCSMRGSESESGIISGQSYEWLERVMGSAWGRVSHKWSVK